jgi:hypothetical protein
MNMSEESKDLVVFKDEPEAKKTKRYRLLTRAQMHGAVREPGYVFTLAEGELGPHRTVVASNHGAQITDHMDAKQDLVDVPLYEEHIEPEAKLAPDNAGKKD